MRIGVLGVARIAPMVLIEPAKQSDEIALFAVAASLAKP